MVKKNEVTKSNGEDVSFVDGLIEKIQSGYMVKTKPKFSKKTFSKISTAIQN